MKKQTETPKLAAPQKSPFIFLCLAALLSVLVVYNLQTTSYAQSREESPLVVVDKGGDEVDGDTSPGQTTLREAVEQAVDGDTIVFAPALNGTTIGLLEPIAIDKNIFINGGGEIAISGEKKVGVLEVLPQRSLFITGTLIIDGNAQNGGGLHIDASAQVIVSHSRLEGNNASSTGGAISNQGSLKLWDTTLAFNSGGIGGGLHNDGGSVEIRNTTFYSNTAVASAAGIFNSAGMNIYNTTFSANRSSSRGGGIFNNTAGDLVLNHTTFSDNEADEGSGLYNGGKLALFNSILANGIGDTDCFSHPSANFAGNGHTLIEDGSCEEGAVFFGYRSGDPRLESLADNGGNTQTHALRVASPAINTAELAGCPATDQRGIGRPVGTVCDRGAYESTVDLKSTLLVGLDRAVCHMPKSNIDAVVRSQPVDVNFAALAGRILDLNLFAGQPPASAVRLLGLRDNLDFVSSDAYIWNGHVDQKPDSDIHLSVTNAGMELIGRIWTKDGTYEISPVPGSDYHCLTEISEDALYIGEDSLIPPSTESRSSAAPYAATAAADDGSILDVLVVYTPQAKTEAGGEAAIQAQAQKFVDLANQVHANSAISHRLALVGASEVAYSRLSCPAGGNCHITDLERLTQKNDGFLDEIHQLRDTHHADMVMLIVRDADDYSTGGMAWVAAAAIPEADDEAFAFGLGVLGCAKGLCFVHEAGHIRGLNHDWYTSDRKVPFPWGHGYINPAAQFRTIMAYANYCIANAHNCPMVPYFSNPDLSVNGAPAGVPNGSATNCTKGQSNPNPLACAADSRQVLNETDTAVSRYRSSQNVWTGNANSDWANPANWTMQEGPSTGPKNVSRAPRTIDDVLIPSTPAGGNFPRINGDVKMRNLTIENGATLTQESGELEVDGLWEEQGTGKFVATGGTVRFAGRLAQTIKMNGASNLPAVIINTQGNGSVTLDSDIQIVGDLTLQAGAALDLGSGGYIVNLTGNWADNGATVLPGNSQVIMAGQTQSIDKATQSTILSEGFNQFSTCCVSSVPAGWKEDGAAFYQGPIFGLPSPTANRWETKNDGWLFTPPLSLNTATLYQLEYKVATQGGTQQVSVALGNQQSVAGMTQNLDGATLDNSALVSRTVNFTVGANGSYYLGFRSQKSGGGFTMFDDVIIRSIQKISFFDLAVQSGSTAVLQNLAVGNSLSIGAGTTLTLPADTTVDGIVTNNGTLR